MHICPTVGIKPKAFSTRQPMGDVEILRGRNIVVEVIIIINYGTDINMHNRITQKIYMGTYAH